jgi:hypothetical protein
MSATLAPPRVGAEHRGLARRFRDEVRSVDLVFDRTVAAICRPLRARLQRHPRLRHELVAQAVRLYHSTTPARFRIGEVAVTPDRDQFAIKETRITSTWLRCASWEDDEPEPGVAVIRFSLKLEGGRLKDRWDPAALISLHALSRWHERSGHRDHAILVRDLSLLASVDPGDGHEIETPDGCWLGGVVGMKGPKVATRTRNIRTWR